MSTQQNIQPATTKYPNDCQQSMWLSSTENGCEPAFNHIVNRYQQSIFNLCYRMLSNKNEAEDATQEIFLRAYANLGSYDNTRKFSTWLFSIASHYCIDRLRKRQFQVVSWDGLAEGYRFTDQNTPQPEKLLIEAELAAEVHHLLETLPSTYRTVIILKYWQSMSYEEIANTLDTTVGAVKSKLFRARKEMAARTTTGV